MAQSKCEKKDFGRFWNILAIYGKKWRQKECLNWGQKQL
jgi:hypothetical protein